MVYAQQRVAERAPRALLRLSALIAAVVSSAAGAQGIYPGNLSPEGYKLPGGIEPVVHLRTYYFDQESTAGVPSEAWAIGGWAGLRTPWYGEMVQFGLLGYTSLKLYGPDDRAGSRLLTPDQGNIGVIGEAFAAVRFYGQTATAYRQLLDRPFINPQDTRMVPHTFEAYTIGGGVASDREALSYIGGYITKIKLRDANSFRWMSEAAGSSGDHQGVVFAGATYTFDKARNGYVRVDEQYGIDTFNTFYADVRYPLAIDDRTTLVLGAQAYPQSGVGDKQLGSFSTWGYGLQAALSYGPFEGQLYWTQTGKERDTLSPWGDHASYLNLMQVAFNTAGEKAWALGGKVDFAPFGAPGLSAAAIYASGSDRIAFASGAPVGDRNETNVRVDYKFPKGSVAEGLSGAVRYSWLRQDNTPQTATQLRIYLNYDVRF
ncbi:MAG TPA: OprD family outer membrane porin [Burkholderiaceae bacterium]|nr:OprD family outer membrane porin [Burkholderiaceae bacterium]